MPHHAFPGVGSSGSEVERGHNAGRVIAAFGNATRRHRAGHGCVHRPIDFGLRRSDLNPGVFLALPESSATV
jgi:hypothetical protein